MPLPSIRLRFAVRSLRSAPGFTTAAVVLLGLGIGMSTAMFAVYRAVVVERLPVSNQDRLVVMHPLDRGGAHLDVPQVYLGELRKDTRTLEAIGGVYHLGAVASPLLDDGKPLDLTSGYVTSNLFDVLGVQPYRGRMLRPEDSERGAPHVVVITYSAWRRVFGQDAHIIGRSLTAPSDRSRMTIVGIAPPGLEYPAGVDGWQPMTSTLGGQVDIIARLAPGATIDAARSELTSTTQRVNPFIDSVNTYGPPIFGAEARTFTQAVLGNVRPALVALTAAVALLLVIACVNVGSLLIVRGAGRAREFAIRRAVGASALDVCAQLMIENGLLGVAGGVLGLALAGGLVRTLLFFAPGQLPRADVIRIGGAPLGIAIAATLGAMMMFGLAPAIAGARTDPAGALRADTRVGSGARQRRARRWLVSSQVALAAVMLAAALLLSRSLASLETMDLGYTPGHLTLLRLTGPEGEMGTGDERSIRFADQVIARLRNVPGVVSLASVESPPFKGESVFITKMSRADLSDAALEKSPFIPWEMAESDYFRTLGIPIVKGRAFLPTDTVGAPYVVIVSETLARRLWPGEDAVGKQMRSPHDSLRTILTVVGVARDTHFRNLRQAAPAIYWPWAQQQRVWWGYIAVRTRGEIGAVLPSIERAITELFPGIVVVRAQRMDQLLAGPLAQPRLSAFLLSAFGGVALLLAAIGLYSVMSSAVRQQTREIGIRIALGASQARVRRAVLGEAMVVVGAGSIVGLVVAVLSTRLLSSQLFGVSPLDPVSFAVPCVSLLAVGLCASYLPARYATKIDPARALRSE